MKVKCCVKTIYNWTCVWKSCRWHEPITEQTSILLCWYSRSRGPKHFPEFLVIFLLYFLISLHCFVTSVALSFPVAVLATLTHTVLQFHTDLSCFCSTGNTHTAWYLLCPQKLMWKLHSISQRAELHPSSPYIGLCLFSDHINFTCLSRFFSEIPCFSLVIS